MGGPASGQRWNEHIVDETHLVEQGYRAGDHEYPATKLLIEKFFNDSAEASGGKWDTFTVNPGDIVGPIISPHLAKEVYQGKIAGAIQGIPIPQKNGGSPWIPVDVRDAARFQIALAESKTVECG